MEFSRREQLTEAAGAVERHAVLGEKLRIATQTHATLSSHLDGVYKEVDKLTKGKTLISTSDLLVDTVNSLIDDAKALIYRDTYLDRLKKFVPAGDNPTYPDVLLSLRILQQSSQRFGSMIETETTKHITIGAELQTTYMALRIAEQTAESPNDDDEGPLAEEEVEEETASTEENSEIDESADESDHDDAEYEDDEDEEEEDDYYVTKYDVDQNLEDGEAAEDWFTRDHRSGDHLFNFRKLDRLGLPKYEPPSTGITFIQNED
jgi:hypothetical protein